MTLCVVSYLEQYPPGPRETVFQVASSGKWQTEAQFHADAQHGFNDGGLLGSTFFAAFGVSGCDDGLLLMLRTPSCRFSRVVWLVTAVGQAPWLPAGRHGPRDDVRPSVTRSTEVEPMIHCFGTSEARLIEWDVACVRI